MNQFAYIFFTHSPPAVQGKRKDIKERDARWSLKICSFKENTNVCPRGKAIEPEDAHQVLCRCVGDNMPKHTP